MRREIGWVGLAAAAGTTLTLSTPTRAVALSCPAWMPVCRAADIATDLAGTAAAGAATSVADTVLDSVAGGFLQAYLVMFRWATTWWLSFTMTPGGLVGTLDAQFTGTIAYLAAFVLVVAVLSAAITTIWRRDGAVVADATAGVFKAVLVIGAGWAGIGLAWRLADQLTRALAPSADTISTDPILAVGAGLAGPGLAVLVILISGIGFVLSLGMALMMIFRLAAVVILGLLLPVAAAGAPGTTTRGWLPKVLGWLMALIFLRPMVAAIYRIGFEFLAGGNDGDPATVAALGDPTAGLPGVPASAAAGLLTMVVGMMTLLVAMFALPVLLRLFTWMFGGGPGGGGAGLAAASLAANGAILARGLHHPTGSGPMPPPDPGSGGPAPSAPAPTAATGGAGGAGPVSAMSGPTAPASGAGATAGASTGATTAAAGGAAAGGPAGLAVAAGVLAVGAAAHQTARTSTRAAETALGEPGR